MIFELFGYEIKTIDSLDYDIYCNNKVIGGFEY